MYPLCELQSGPASFSLLFLLSSSPRQHNCPSDKLTMLLPHFYLLSTCTFINTNKRTTHAIFLKLILLLIPLLIYTFIHKYTHAWTHTYVRTCMVYRSLWLPGKHQDIRHRNEGFKSLHFLVNCDWWKHHKGFTVMKRMGESATVCAFGYVCMLSPRNNVDELLISTT